MEKFFLIVISIYEDSEERTFKTMPTLILIGTNVAMYVYTSLLSGNFIVINGNVVAYYGLSNSAVYYHGYYWQLISSMFVHLNILHIGSNMLFLFIFGLKAEDLFSTAKYYSIYFISGLAGNLLTLLAGSMYVSAGASGAIMGVFGANVIFLRKAVGQPILISLAYAFMFFVLTASEGTNLLAHLGGLLAGLALGYLLAGTRNSVRASR